MGTAKRADEAHGFVLSYSTLRSVTAPEDQRAGRKRYCGIATADNLWDIGWEQNVRSFLGQDEEGNRRKSTLVNQAIRRTIELDPDLFPILNSGVVIVAREAEVDDAKRIARLTSPSIINGAQTIGVLKQFFGEEPDDKDFPSVSFELVVSDDENLMAEISIARNFQNRVADLSIYGRKGIFGDLEKAMRKHLKTVKLRTSETDFAADFIDTEKLVQAITAMLPSSLAVPSAAKRERTLETLYRVYAYRHRARCLKDFATVMDGETDIDFSATRKCYLDLAWPAWQLYTKLKGEQFFSSLRKVRGESVDGKKVVADDGVPDGMVFPMLSALSEFVKFEGGRWILQIPESFPWRVFFDMAKIQFTTTAKHNPNTMGKDHNCYTALRGQIAMYFAMTRG